MVDGKGMAKIGFEVGDCDTSQRLVKAVTVDAETGERTAGGDNDAAGLD